MSERDTIGFYRDGVGEWRWTQKAPNGRDVDAASEGYQNFHDAFNNASRDRMLDETDTVEIFTVVPLREIQDRAWKEGHDVALNWAIRIQAATGVGRPVSPYEDPDR